jgi:2'-5' RNA ligase
MARRIRTFIALGLDKAIIDHTVALQQTLARTGAEVKWVEPENLHLTLLFLGEVGERELLDVCRAIADGASRHAPFAMTVETAGCFPNPRRPRILWVGVGEGTQEVVALHDTLETALLDLGCHRREDRQYTPHVTLGRVKSEQPNEKLSTALAKQAGWQCGRMLVREVLVLGSELQPDGPVYTVLSRSRLGEAGDGPPPS